uniref:Uncharacterized protein n=1 Tax=viral metagenome TaxID=1070528 RepID=A0A6M3MF95_9ZZZZ
MAESVIQSGRAFREVPGANDGSDRVRIRLGSRSGLATHSLPNYFPKPLDKCLPLGYTPR